MKAIEAARLCPTDTGLAALAAQAPNAEIVDDGECMIEAMDPRKGHVTLKWDRKNPQDVAEAEKVFGDLIEKGFLAFALEKDGTKGEQVTTFDPRVKGYVLGPALQGG